MTTDLQGLFAGLDKESLDRLASRRETLRAGGRLAALLALSSVPVALATTAKAAFASSSLPDAVVRVLNFALTLEYLEATFYNRGIRSGVIPAGKARRVFETIQDHENAHVAFLKQTLGSQAIPKPEFDFTAGGALPNPFKHYEVFQILAQGFEDTGVRAYKGQLRALKPYDAYLTAAATIHSVEARHASEVRRLRGQKGWIPFDDPPAPAALKAVYEGEDNRQQLTIDVSEFLTFESAKGATEAFDEPLTRAEVLAIANPFIV
jgi:rubrerythrin